jgi:cytochrome c oxidase assembly protein subunit 15
MVLTVTGAAVRVTGSGLGCRDWPTCNENRVVAELSWHPMIEFVNRVFTGVVSVFVIVAVLGAFLRMPKRKDLVVLSLLLALGIAAEAVLGGQTVKHQLDPKYVMAHFILSMLLIWVSAVLSHRAMSADTEPIAIVHRDYMILGRAMAVLTAIVVFIGTMVTGSGPHGGDEHVVRLDYSIHEITKIHGIFVWFLIAVTVLTLWRLHVAHASPTLMRKGEYCVAAMLVQGAIGYTQYAMHFPPVLALVHVAGAVAVWSTVLWFNLSFYERYDPQGINVYDGDSYPGSDFFVPTPDSNT